MPFDELKHIGFGLEQLRGAKATWKELRSLGFSAVQLEAFGANTPRECGGLDLPMSAGMVLIAQIS